MPQRGNLAGTQRRRGSGARPRAPRHRERQQRQRTAKRNRKVVLLLLRDPQSVRHNARMHAQVCMQKFGVTCHAVHVIAKRALDVPKAKARSPLRSFGWTMADDDAVAPATPRQASAPVHGGAGAGQDGATDETHAVAKSAAKMHKEAKSGGRGFRIPKTGRAPKDMQTARTAGAAAAAAIAAGGGSRKRGRTTEEESDAQATWIVEQAIKGLNTRKLHKLHSTTAQLRCRGVSSARVRVRGKGTPTPYIYIIYLYKQKGHFL